MPIEIRIVATARSTVLSVAERIRKNLYPDATLSPVKLFDRTGDYRVYLSLDEEP